MKTALDFPSTKLDIQLSTQNPQHITNVDSRISQIRSRINNMTAEERKAALRQKMLQQKSNVHNQLAVHSPIQNPGAVFASDPFGKQVVSQNSSLQDKMLRLQQRMEEQKEQEIEHITLRQRQKHPSEYAYQMDHYSPQAFKKQRSPEKPKEEEIDQLLAMLQKSREAHDDVQVDDEDLRHAQQLLSQSASAPKSQPAGGPKKQPGQNGGQQSSTLPKKVSPQQWKPKPDVQPQNTHSKRPAGETTKKSRQELSPRVQRVLSNDNQDQEQQETRQSLHNSDLKNQTQQNTAPKSTQQRKVSSTLQFLSELQPSQQKQISQLLNGNQANLTAGKDVHGNVVVKIDYLADPKTEIEKKQAFEGKIMKSISFLIHKDQVVKQGQINTRQSKAIEEYMERKKQSELKALQQLQLQSIDKQGKQRTVIWLNKQVFQIMQQRLIYMKNESRKVYNQNKKILIEQMQYLNNNELINQQLKLSGQRLDESKEVKINNESIINLISNHLLVTKVFSQLGQDPMKSTFKKVPEYIGLHQFILTVYLKQNMQISIQEYINQLNCSLIHFARISAAARFLILFYNDQVTNYQIYKQLINNQQAENTQTVNAFEVYRNNQYITEGEFLQIRRNETQIMPIILLIFERITSSLITKRVQIPVSLIDQINKEIEQTTKRPDQSLKVPRFMNCWVVNYHRQKADIGNLVVQILNDFAVQLKLLIPKEVYPQFLSSQFIMTELSGFNIWAHNEQNEYEAELFCCLEALVRVFNAVLVELQKWSEDRSLQTE